MESRVLRILVSLGVPGVALGIFYLLFREFNFTFVKVSDVWTGPIVILFMVLVFGITFYALTLWKPSPKLPPESGVAFSVPKENSPTFRFVIDALAAMDKKTVEYNGFQDKTLESLVISQDILASSIEQAMQMVRGLTRGAVPEYDVSRSSFGGYVVTARVKQFD